MYMYNHCNIFRGIFLVSTEKVMLNEVGVFTLAVIAGYTFLSGCNQCIGWHLAVYLKLNKKFGAFILSLFLLFWHSANLFIPFLLTNQVLSLLISYFPSVSFSLNVLT